MRANLYPKLAWDGIRKNKRFYLPYLLTCIGMVMMCYILRYLASMPRANYALGLAGVLILAGAYYIALSIESPLAALAWFFVAVCMVIASTYLLFIAGPVALCRLLQKNRRYYYQPNHFVSVSSMVYRMKRNGAGLASICILSTMVLVTMMGAGSLYAGKEDSLRARYPRDFAVTADFLTEGADLQYSEDKAADFYAQMDEVLDNFGAQA